MSRAANVFTARVLDEESLVGEVTKHPRHDGIRESEETPCFLARDAEAGHLLELGANAEHRRIPQDVRQALGAAHLPCAIEHERLFISSPFEPANSWSVNSSLLVAVSGPPPASHLRCR